MCLICVQLDENKMHPVEAYRALKEYDMTATKEEILEREEHRREILRKIHAKAAKVYCV